MNERHGYLSFSVNKLLSLPPLTTKTVFQLLVSHVGGARGPIALKKYEEICKHLLSGNKGAKTCGTCILYFPDLKKDTMVIGRTLPPSDKQRSAWIPISVGQTIHWDGRWRITLKPLKEPVSRQRSLNQAPSRAVNSEEQLYVRHMKEPDYTEARRGVRRIGAVRLPPVKARAGLPVICTESGYVVLAPHFGVTDRTYGVDCDITFDPLLPLLKDSETHVC